MTPVAITGMHRSGTSLVAALLQAHGLWLGAPDQLLGATAHNPEGHFENLRVSAVNDAVLELHGGSWDRVPELPPGWLDEPRVAALLAEATDLVAGFPSRPWGFKDPRTSLLVDFWRRAAGVSRFVVCVRHPLEVAQSLGRRNLMPKERALDLWMAHNRALLAGTSVPERFVVDYAELCARPVEICDQLLGWLDLPLSRVQPAVVEATVNPALRHHRAAPEETAGGTVPGPVDALYQALLAEAAHASLAPATAAEQTLDEVRRLSRALAGLDLAVRDLQVHATHLCYVTERIEATLKELTDGQG